MRRCWWLALLLGACAAPRAERAAPAQPPPSPAHAALVEDLQAWARRQIRELGIPGIALGILQRDGLGDGQPWLWTDSLGEVAPDSVYPVASISKLVTDTVVMRMVERGELDLDRPVADWLPGLGLRNDSGTPVTLRHLMSHRSGLVREPPVGHYFDPGEPGLAATVDSLAGSALVYPPGERIKYSNAAIGIVGRVVEVVAGRPFAEVADREVFAPLGMTESSFAARADLDRRVPRGIMWTYDGRAIPTPSFRYGFGPAADLRSTPADLLAFARSWFVATPAAERILQPESLSAMWQPQFARPGASAGVGLGFFVDRFLGELRVRHGGATYGFASTLAALPERGLAVFAVCTVDFANAVSDALAERALAGLLALQAGRQLPPVQWPEPVGRQRARALAGRYGDGTRWFDLLARGEELFYLPSHGEGCRLRVLGDELVGDDRTSVGGLRLRWREGRIELGGRAWPRQPDRPPAPPPADLVDKLGEYGWPHNSLIVYEDAGRLCMQIEWLVRSPLLPLGGDRYRFPDRHMYAGELVTFRRGAAGAVEAVDVGGVLWPRRAIGTAAGATFRIEPLHGPDELRAMAAAASPPVQPEGLRQPDLVELRELEPGIRYDIRYASTNNFMGMRFYRQARAMLQRPAAEALVKAHRALGERGYGLLVHDAYRPWSVTRMFWDATPEHLKEFVADPSRGSRHNRGCAVDLTLYELASGAVVPMPSGFDEFTPRAYPDYPGGTWRQRWHRELLRAAMEAQGFAVYDREWWHYDHYLWQQYPVLNRPLADR